MVVDRSQNRHVVIGVIILIALIALPVLVLFVPDLIRRFQSSAEIVVVMPEAGVLQKEAPVWIAGREVGRVMHVELRPGNVDSTERVAVRMSIPRKYLTHIRKDSQVRVTSASLIGKPALDILPGTAGAPIVQDDDTLHIRIAGTLTGTLESTFALNRTFEQFFADLRKLQELGTASRQRELAALNARMKRNLTAATTEFRTLMVSLRGSPINTFSDPEFKQTLASLQARSTQLAEALRLAAERAGRAQSDMQPALTRMTARGDTIRAILTDIQARIDAGGGGLLVRAQTDTAIFKAFHEAQVQLDSLIAETKRSPSRFWF
jgi:ABC-type transporter Mla subunit MlaD